MIFYNKFFFGYSNTRARTYTKKKKLPFAIRRTSTALLSACFYGDAVILVPINLRHSQTMTKYSLLGRKRARKRSKNHHNVVEIFREQTL